MTKAVPFDPKWLRKDFEELISSAELSDEQRHFLRSRWLESLLWMEATARWTRNSYYALRLTTVIGAVVVPALVGINAIGKTATVVTWLTFSISLVVGVSAAIEGFFQLGARWRHYRSLVEDLKAEGWAFFELSGPYKGDGITDATAFPTFVERVNELLRRETQSYITEIATPQQKTATDGTKATSRKPAADQGN